MSWDAEEFRALYQAGDFLPNRTKSALGLLMPVDVYVQDPFVAEQNKGVALSAIHVRCEPNLSHGPTSARIAVVDYDADSHKLEPPAQWDARKRRFVLKKDGKAEPISRQHCSEPQFHQVNVWAIIQSVLDMYEATWVLGRSAPWAFEGNRIIVVPHAGYLANAFYDRSSKSIQFYYFDAQGKRVYTCLSHDIIAHETGHAILDGLRPYYLEDSSLQTTAFHEFVADLTAIMTSLLNNELRWEVGKQSGGDLSQDTIVSALAEEFGRYATGRPYLRSAQNPNGIAAVKASHSPYDWSEVLTGAMFDILKGVVAQYMRRELKSGQKVSTRQALSWGVNRFRRIALQPLDYLPPVDVQFGDYARAVLRADEVADALDEHGFRPLMRAAFAARGIECPSEGDELERLRFYAYDIERVSRSRTDAYHFLNENRRQLCLPAEQDISVVNLYQTDKTVMGGARLPREIVVQYAWREDVELKGKEYGALAGQTASLLCGGTLIFDGRGNLLSWMRKQGSGKQEPNKNLRRRYCEEERNKGLQRREQLQGYLKLRVAAGLVGLLEREATGEINTRPPVVATCADDGTLRLRVSPHLRHWAAE